METLLRMSIIVAVSIDNVIGVEGKLPWEGKLRGDMAYFKKTTIGHGGNVTISGRKTFMSIPEEFRPLPGRINIVLSRNRDWVPPFYDVVDNCHDAANGAGAGQPCIIVASSLDEALTIAGRDTYGEDREIFIVGGGSVYEQSLQDARITRVHLTRVETEVENGDTFFPVLDLGVWNETKGYTSHEPDERNMYGYQIKIYERV